MSENHSDDDVQLSLEDTLKRFASTKGAGAPKPPKIDRRAETSKANMAKARAAKIEALRRKREEEANQIELDGDESEDSDSDEEELVLNRKKKVDFAGMDNFNQVVPGISPHISNDRIMEMMMALALGNQKQKVKPKKKVVRKTVIQLPTPAAAAPVAPPNPKMENMRRILLNN